MENKTQVITRKIKLFPIGNKEEVNKNILMKREVIIQ